MGTNLILARSPSLLWRPSVSDSHFDQIQFLLQSICHPTSPPRQEVDHSYKKKVLQFWALSTCGEWLHYVRPYSKKKYYIVQVIQRSAVDARIAPCGESTWASALVSSPTLLYTMLCVCSVYFQSRGWGTWLGLSSHSGILSISVKHVVTLCCWGESGITCILRCNVYLYKGTFAWNMKKKKLNCLHSAHCKLLADLKIRKYCIFCRLLVCVCASYV